MHVGHRRRRARDGWGRSLVVAAAALLVAGVAGASDDKAPGDKAAAGAQAAENVTYVKHIQPILKESCVGCHKAPAANARGGGGGPGGRPRGPAGGLRLDDKAMILKGGKHGKAVVVGKGEESLLYRVLKEPVKIGDDEIHAMPKARQGQEFTPINDDEIELIKTWIDQGAK